MSCHHVFNLILDSRRCRIYLSQGHEMPNYPGFCSVLTMDNIKYDSFCDDFGPMNLLSIINFIQILDHQADDDVSDAIVFIADDGPRALTNAAFLLGAYMLIMLEMDPSAVAERFAGIDPARLEPYRDASFDPPDFGLSLADCWGGIYRAMAHGWLARPAQFGPYLWGRINIAEYAQYDDPLNAEIGRASCRERV